MAAASSSKPLLLWTGIVVVRCLYVCRQNVAVVCEECAMDVEEAKVNCDEGW